MARSDRSAIALVLDRARKFAHDVEARKSSIPLPKLAEHDARLALYDALITDGALKKATRTLYASEHYVQAVSEAYKVVNNTTKKKAGASDKDGPPMMMIVFDRAKPVLRVNEGKTVSQLDEQEGYKFVYAGAMMGIRNPRAHEHEMADDPAIALEMLVLANHLMRVIARAVRTRRRRPTGVQRQV